jgi:hypothetical protein
MTDWRAWRERRPPARVLHLDSADGPHRGGRARDEPDRCARAPRVARRYRRHVLAHATRLPCAVESALAHGRDIEVAIDLYRSKVLDIAPAPASLSQERQEFTDLLALYESDSVEEAGRNAVPRRAAAGRVAAHAHWPRATGIGPEGVWPKLGDTPTERLICARPLPRALARYRRLWRG